jgi:hypothetical protein
MTPQRIIFAIVLSLQAACVAAAQQNILPSWTPFLTLAGSVLLALMSSIKPGGPPPVGPTIAVLGVVVGLSVSACSLFTPANVQTALDAAKVACVLEHAFVDDATLNAVCGLVSTEQRVAAHDIVAAERVRASKRGVCVTLDGGADAADGGSL